MRFMYSLSEVLITSCDCSFCLNYLPYLRDVYVNLGAELYEEFARNSFDSRVILQYLPCGLTATACVALSKVGRSAEIELSFERRDDSNTDFTRLNKLGKF